MIGSIGIAKPPIDPNEARPHVSWQDADRVIGRIAFVSGRVAEIQTVGRITLLDFSDHKPPGFAGVIQADDLSRFPAPPSELYAGRIVRIRGLVTTYRGVPQIPVTSPAQIEILDGLPKSDVPAEVQLREQRPTLRFAAYNVLNLFDDADDPYRWDEATPAKPRKQLEALASSIRKLDADVVALEEVENRGYLERFVEVFLPDMGYEHVVEFEGNDDRGIDVALISRIPVGAVQSNRHIQFPGPDGKPMRFARDVLEVTLQPSNAEDFQVWVVHLVSNFEGREYAEPFRLAETKQLRKMLDAELTRNSNARFVVAGDFNDTWDSQSLQTVVGEGPLKLWSAALDHTGKTPITYNQQPYLSMIDFVLCSPAMAEQYVKGSYHVEPGSPDETGSDHNPVVVEFRLHKAAP
jgi:endonuclease/exonuclease/phosphatase family metal-dependent hydrolase